MAYFFYRSNSDFTLSPIPYSRVILFYLYLSRLKKVQDRKKRIKAKHDEELRQANIDPEAIENQTGVPNLLVDADEDQILF